MSRVASYGLSAVVVIMFWGQGFPIELEEIKESVDYISRRVNGERPDLSLLWRCSGLLVLPGHWLFAALAAGYSRGVKAPRGDPDKIHAGVAPAQWQNMGPDPHPFAAEETFIVDSLAERGVVPLSTFQAKGSSVYLFDLPTLKPEGRLSVVDRTA